jgi:hypothetical protein
MKCPTHSVVSAIFALSLIAVALQAALSSDVGAQQEPEDPKFRLAPPGVTGVRADEWTIGLDKKLTPEEFERELERILIQYDAKLLTIDEVTSKSFGKPAKHLDTYSAQIQAPEARARQIAEDEMVTYVNQEHDVQFLPSDLIDAKSNGPGAQPGGARPLSGQSPSKIRPRSGKP